MCTLACLYILLYNSKKTVQNLAFKTNMLKNYFQTIKEFKNALLSVNVLKLVIVVFLFVNFIEAEPIKYKNQSHLVDLTDGDVKFLQAQFISMNTSYMLVLLSILMFFLLAIISYKLVVTLKYKKKLVDLFSAQTNSLEKFNVSPNKVHNHDHLFFGMFAHDIKGALSAMGRMSNELLQNIQSQENDKSKVLAQELNTGIQFLNQHVKNYLIWLLSKNNLAVEDEKVDINDFLGDIAKTAEAIYVRNNNELSLSLLESQTYISTKPLLLKIILLNIIDNAFKHTINGIVLLKLEVIENALVISCKDTGLGMTEDELTNLSSFKLDNSNSDLDSFGMGYRIVYDLIELLQGEIEIISDSNTGTEVKVKLLNYE